MKVTFEQLIEKIPTFNNEAGIGKSYVLELMEKTREATIKECVSKVTWYSKEKGFDGENKVIKIGCDYQHSWDEGREYDLEWVKRDVINTIDVFLNYIPDYKYWCCGNGNLYSLKDGIVKNGTFYSKEYYGDKEWFRELEPQS